MPVKGGGNFRQHKPLTSLTAFLHPTTTAFSMSCKAMLSNPVLSTPCCTPPAAPRPARSYSLSLTSAFHPPPRLTLSTAAAAVKKTSYRAPLVPPMEWRMDSASWLAASAGRFRSYLTHKCGQRGAGCGHVC